MSSRGAEAELILASAAVAARRDCSRTRAAALARGVDWERLVAMLLARRLLPQLGERILQSAGEDAPASFVAAVERALSQTRHQAALLQLVGARVRRALDAAGIRSLALKGPFLAEAIYGDPGRRASGDIDLLVAPGELQAAVTVARASGYASPTDHVPRGGLPLLHYTLHHERFQAPPLELHWRIHWYEREFARDMLARSIEDPPYGLRATPIDELAGLLLFYARDGFHDLRLATDIATWWDSCGGSIAPGALGELTARYPALERSLLCAASTAERVVGLPSEPLLGAGRRLRIRPRLAARLANPDGRGAATQSSADVALVDWLLSAPGGQLEFIRRQLLPPREVLGKRARARRERRVSPLGHGMRVLLRCGLSVAHLLRPLRRPNP